MTMPSSGPLSLALTTTPRSVASELNRGLTSTISMNDSKVRALAGASATSGTSWSMSSLYSKRGLAKIWYPYQLSSWSPNWPFNGMISGVATNGAATPRFVLVGSKKISSTTDFITFSDTTTTYTFWNDIIWNGSYFIVSGGDGYVAVSSDGINWTENNTLAYAGWGAASIYSCASNGSNILAVGQSGSAAIGNLAGNSWTNYQTALRATTWSTYDVWSAVWAGSKWVIGGQKGYIATSTNGSSWSFQSGLLNTSWGTDYSLGTVNTLAWNGSTLVAGGPGGRIATSSDGISWTYRSGLSSTAWGTATVTAIYWVNTTNPFFMAIGADSEIATSPDGITWTYLTTLNESPWVINPNSSPATLPNIVAAAFAGNILLIGSSAWPGLYAISYA